MNKTEIDHTAAQLADLTFKLLASCHEKEERLARQYRLTQAEFRCLRHLHADENTNNKEIAERMNLSASRLTRIIDGLVAKGYVVREIEPNDRRNMRVSLSEKGTEFVCMLDEAYLNIHAEILNDIANVQHQPLINAMTHFLSALERWIAKSA